MSAFIVSRKHIATMVWNMREVMGRDAFDAAARWKLRLGPSGTATTSWPAAVATALWKENFRSVNHRYNERSRVTKPIVDADFDGVERVGLAQLATLINCYEYQSCEHDGWPKSGAFVFISACREMMLDQLLRTHHASAFSTATWSI